MSKVVMARRLSHQQAQKRLSHWIKMQKWWDQLLSKSTGKEVYPPAHQVYRVEKDGRRYCVIFDDPTM